MFPVDGADTPGPRSQVRNRQRPFPATAQTVERLVVFVTVDVPNRRDPYVAHLPACSPSASQDR